jgi:hypothetical protein
MGALAPDDGRLEGAFHRSALKKSFVLERLARGAVKVNRARDLWITHRAGRTIRRRRARSKPVIFWHSSREKS